MVEKVSPLPSALVTGFFSRHKMQEILPGKNRKMQKKCNIQGGMSSRKKTQKKNLTAKNKMSQNANNNNDNNAFAYLALKNTTTEAPPTRIFFREGLRIEQRRITIKMELTKQTKGWGKNVVPGVKLFVPHSTTLPPHPTPLTRKRNRKVATSALARWTMIWWDKKPAPLRLSQCKYQFAKLVQEMSVV